MYFFYYEYTPENFMKHKDNFLATIYLSSYDIYFQIKTNKYLYLVSNKGKFYKLIGPDINSSIF